MGTILATYDAIDARVSSMCAPLFATGRFLDGGHTEASINATVTFVEFENRIYAVTCHHVIAAFYAASVRENRQLVPSLHNGRAIIQFGSYGSGESFNWSFHSCRTFPTPAEILEGDQEALAARERRDAELPDIAIADITAAWASLTEQRGAEALSLDAWERPDWSVTQLTWVAFGFPDGHKYEKDDKLAVPMPKVRANLETSSLDQRDEFVLCSTLSSEHGWGFSGMSGGPIFAPDKIKDSFYFVGITYEGSPGLRNSQSDDQAFLSKADILLRGYLISPATFRAWLELRRHGVSFK